MTKEKKWFKSFELFTVPRSVVVGNGCSIKAVGKGSINVDMLVKNKWVPNFLEEVSDMLL